MSINKKIFIVVVIVFTTGILFREIVFLNFKQDEVYDQLEITNTNFKLRITAYKEKGAYLPGVRFVCQSAFVHSDDWQEILTKKGDELIPLQNKQAKFVSNQIGYIFISNYYLITTDAGKNWTIWDAEKKLHVEQYRQQYNLSPYIEEIKLQPDGTGVMKLQRYSKEREEGSELITKDYGVNWIKVE